MYPLFYQEGPTGMQYLFCQGVLVKMKSCNIITSIPIKEQTWTDNITKKQKPDTSRNIQGSEIIDRDIGLSKLILQYF